MHVAVAPIGALLLSTTILLAGNGLQGILLPIRAQIEAFSTLHIGVLGSAYFLGFAAGCLLAPHIVRRVGHIRSFIAMVCIASSAALAHALLLEPLVWWTLRAITGFCFAALYMVIESWLNDRSTTETRGSIFSIYTIITLTVLSIGQLMITFYDPADFPVFCIVGILISLAAVPVALTATQAPEPINTVRLRLGFLYRASPVGLVGCLTTGLTNGSFWSLGPVFAEQSGMNVSGAAFFMSMTVIAGALGQAPLGFTSDRMDRRKVIAFSCIAAATAGIGMALLNKLVGLGILVFTVLFGAFGFPLYALCVTHTNDNVSPEAYVETASGLLLTYAIGAMIGPLLASALMDLIGEEGLFAFTATIHGAMATFAMNGMRRRAPVPKEDRTIFADALLTAQTVAPLDLGVESTQAHVPDADETHDAHRADK